MYLELKICKPGNENFTLATRTHKNKRRQGYYDQVSGPYHLFNFATDNTSRIRETIQCIGLVKRLSLSFCLFSLEPVELFFHLGLVQNMRQISLWIMFRV
uniref:Uncharacterized protein n=1 Tax=Parascaris univalens TaxID=6257 RepID=A0A915A230_PARUN